MKTRMKTSMKPRRTKQRSIKVERKVERFVNERDFREFCKKERAKKNEKDIENYAMMELMERVKQMYYTQSLLCVTLRSRKIAKKSYAITQKIINILSQQKER